MFAGRLKEARPSGAPEDCIMIVDDNVEIIEALASLLQPRYHIVSCLSYEEAKNRLSPEVKLVLLDIKMACKDGIKAFKLLKQEREDLRIIFHSAYPGSSENAQAVEGLSHSGYLTKGEYDLPELLTLIRETMNRAT
jgi:CheY-like chemotaxis protein